MSGAPLLCVDIGNSHTSLGLLRDGEVAQHWRVATEERRTADEWGVLVARLLSGSDAPPRADLGGVALCATVPAVLHEWREMIGRFAADRPVVIVEPGIKTGVPVRTDNPREVGADRIVNALAVATLHGGPAIIVDFGTATTFDLVSAQGEYLGGAIAPGVEISLQALGRRGAQLRMVELARPRTVVARNTVEALQSGVFFGTACQVDGMVERMAAEIGLTAGEVHVVATGGLAPMLVEECRTVTVHDPFLTLRGLEMVFARNT